MTLSDTQKIGPITASGIRRRRPESHEGSLAVRCAWLQFIGGHSQSEISTMLGISRIKVNRLIAEAQRDKRVKFFVEGSADHCISLEHTLCSAFGLNACDVAPNVSEMDPPFDVLGSAGANYLLRVADNTDIKLIGIGTGRTLSAVAENLPPINRHDLDFVSLIGTFRRTTAIDPYDVIHRLATKVDGSCFALPLPFVAESVEAKAVLLSQIFVKDVFKKITAASIKLVGVGPVTSKAHTVEIGMLSRSEIGDLKRLGAVSEAAGQFFDQHGKLVESSISERMIGHSAHDLKSGHTTIVAGGKTKVKAIEAALKAGFCSHLITDEQTAAQIVARI